jgi:hypothetical protein
MNQRRKNNMAKYCENCGAKLEETANFCASCGEKVKIEPEKQETGNEDAAFVYCPNCGKQVSKEFEFCTECGRTVKVNQKNSGLKDKKRFPKKMQMKASIVVIALLCATGIGFFAVNTMGKQDDSSQVLEEYKENYVVYLKDDEWYITDEKGDNIQITNDFYGDMKKETKEYYDSGEWVDEYLPYDPDGDWETYVPDYTWQEYWNSVASQYSPVVYTTICGKKKLLLYEDEVREESYGDEYAGGTGSVGSLYWRDMDNLDAEPTLIATDVWSYSVLDNGCISYIPYDRNTDYAEGGGPQERVYYNLATSEIIDSPVREENEIFIESSSDSKKLYIHKKDKDVLLDKDVMDFDDTAKEAGKIYYINEDRELYQCDEKGNQKKIADEVAWMSSAFTSGELYYATGVNEESNYYTSEDGQLFYYNGKKSKKLKEVNGSITQSDGMVALSGKREDIASGKAVCLISVNEKELLVVQDSVIESENDISGGMINEDRNEIYYGCDDGVMYAKIKNNKLVDVALCMDKKKMKLSDEQYISLGGVVDKDYWCVVDGSLYVNNEKIEDIDPRVNLSDAIVEVFDNKLYFDVDGFLAFYDFSKNEEIKISDNIYSKIIKNTGNVFYLKDYDGISHEDIANNPDYVDTDVVILDGVGVSDLYCYSRKGKEILLDTGVLKIAKIN